MHELGSAVETTTLGLESEATPISVETELATARVLVGIELTAVPALVEVESTVAPSSVELEIAAVPAVAGLESAVTYGLELAAATCEPKKGVVPAAR